MDLNFKAEIFENMKNKELSGGRLTFLKMYRKKSFVHRGLILLNSGSTISIKSMQQKSSTLIWCRDPSEQNNIFIEFIYIKRNMFKWNFFH